MKVGRIRTIILITVILALAICLLPWPGRVNVTLPGVRTSADGSAETDVTVTIEGWYLKYLLRQDQMKASVRIQDTETDTDTSINMNGPVLDAPVAEKWCTAPCYHGETNEFEVVNLAFSDALDIFVLERSGADSIYVAAANAREDLPEILGRFSFILG